MTTFKTPVQQLLAFFSVSEEDEIAKKYLKIEKEQNDLWFTPKDDNWISVDDYLPVEGTIVIVCKSNKLVREMIYHNGKFLYAGTLDQTRQITHWQPLPEPKQ